MSGALLNTHDPFLNLALEDYLLYNSREEFFLLYFNDPSVIAGRHQVIFREVDVFEAEKLDIPVIRRISGGGTVYHDHGNLNFTFIRNTSEGRQVDFELHTKPVIEFLKSRGITAALTGKSNITVDGIKISGNAEHVFRERVLHHGTLLLNSSVDTMKRLIRTETTCYHTGAVASNRTAVVNIFSLISSYGSAEDFASALLQYVTGFFKGMTPMEFSDEWFETAQLLADSKYRSWEWNYGFTPPYTFRNTFTACGCCNSIEMSVRDGIIWKCTIAGSDRLAVFAKTLIGCRHDYHEIKEKLTESGIILPEETLRCFF